MQKVFGRTRNFTQGRVFPRDPEGLWLKHVTAVAEMQPRQVRAEYAFLNSQIALGLEEAVRLEALRRRLGRGGRPPGMDEERIEKARRAREMVNRYVETKGTKWGAIAEVAPKIFPQDNPASARMKTQKLLQDLKKQETKTQTKSPA